MASVSKRQWTHKGVERSAWTVRWLDTNGTHKQKTFKTKKEADRYCHQIEGDAYSGIAPLANDSMTVARVCDLFLKAQEDRVNDGRIGKTREYQIRNLVNRSIIPYIGQIKISALNALHVEQFYTDMIRKQKLAPATAKDRVQDLSLICRFAISRTFMRQDPVPEVVASLRGVKAKKIRFLRIDEVQAIMAAVETRPRGQAYRPHLLIKIYIHLALCCGLRLGEINGLKASNVDLVAGILRVKTSLTQFNELKGPKTEAGVRDVALPKSLAMMLAEWTRDFYTPNADGLLFRTKNNTRIPNADFHSVYWAPVLRRAGLDTGDRPHFHALRHFFASWLIKNGMALPDVAAAMGHSKISTTLEIYTHSIDTEESHIDNLRRFGDRLLSGPVGLLPAPSQHPAHPV